MTIFDGVMSQLLLDLDEATVRTHFINIATALTDTRLTPPGGASGLPLVRLTPDL